MADLLELRNVSKSYSRGLLHATSTLALQDISLTLKEDEPTILTVAGESGSGKTTLAMLLLGFIEPSAGQIIYRGQDITTLSRRRPPRLPPRGAGGVPGPVRGLQPVLHRRPPADRADPALQAGPAPGRRPATRWTRR